MFCDYKSRLREIDSLVWKMVLSILHSCGWSRVIAALWPLHTTIVSLNLKLSPFSLTFYFLHDLWYRYCFRFLLTMCMRVYYYFSKSIDYFISLFWNYWIAEFLFIIFKIHVLDMKPYQILAILSVLAYCLVLLMRF